MGKGTGTGVYIKGDAENEVRLRHLEGKPLSLVLDMLDGNVKIGAESSTGFWYCGSIDEYIQTQGSIEYDLELRLRKRYNASNARMRGLIKKPETDLSDYLKALAKNAKRPEDIKPTMEGYMSFVQDRINEINKRAEYTIQQRERRDHYIPLPQRIVKKAYPSIDYSEGHDTTILLLEGNENGTYWTQKEYREGGGKECYR